MRLEKDDPLFIFGRTDRIITRAWSKIPISIDCGPDPAVLASTQTCRGENAAAVRIRNASSGSIEFSIEEARNLIRTDSPEAESVGYMIGTCGVITDAEEQKIGEIGTTRLMQRSRSRWAELFFVGEYEDPVVIAQVSSFHDERPAHIRIHSVFTDGFNYKIEGWSYSSGKHNTENISYLVLTAGMHTLPDGRIVEAGKGIVSHTHTRLSLSSPFDTTPVVLSHSMTSERSGALVTRQRDISAENFQLLLQQEGEDSDAIHPDELIGYVALDFIAKANKYL